MTPPRNQPPPPERRRFLDLTMPLPWLVGCFLSIVVGLVSLGWMAANQNNKLTQIIDSQIKTEQRQTETSARVDTLRDQFMEQKQVQAIILLRVGTLERDGNKK